MAKDKARKALEDALENLKQIGEYGKESKTETAGLSIIKLDNGDGTSGLGVGIVGNSGDLTEVIMRGMGQSKEVRQAIQAAASGFELFGFMFQEDDGEPCDCPNCKAKREQQQKTNS